MLIGLTTSRFTARVRRSLVEVTRAVNLTSSLNNGPDKSADQATSRPMEKSKPSKFIDKSKVPQLNEEDILEKHVGGSGPGGQSVNKSVNACQIKHIPTGIVVKVHQSRSLEQNRQLAREILQNKLDNLYNGEESVEAQKKRLALYRQSIRESQAERRRLLKEAMKGKLIAAEEKV